MHFTSVAIVSASIGMVALAGVITPSSQEKQDGTMQPHIARKPFKPDEIAMKQMKEKAEQLTRIIAGLKARNPDDGPLADVGIYLKAAENTFRFDEWVHADSAKWMQSTLDQGLERAKQSGVVRPRVGEMAGKWVVLGYRSRIDDSIQPYAVLLPHDFGKEQKKWRLDIVLHDRDEFLTEAKFIATHIGAAPKNLDRVILEVYGRGNNGYRWAGETDVQEAIGNFEAWACVRNWGARDFQTIAWEWVDSDRIVLRGFSMGGSGTWHIGLHDPGRFCVLGPEAGFTSTRGAVANFPKRLPDYQEKCLRIYDAVGYAENAFNVPVVAYSGEKDAPNAADTIADALQGFKEPVRLVHLTAPGVEHQMPNEWQDKAEVEYRKYAEKRRTAQPERVRLVMYTPKYGQCAWLGVTELEKTYEKAVVDATRKGAIFTISTTNVNRLVLSPDGEKANRTFGGSVAKTKFQIVIDEQTIAFEDDDASVVLLRTEGKWDRLDYANGAAREAFRKRLVKQSDLQGPIDDAFQEGFVVVKPTESGWSLTTSVYTGAVLDQFAAQWDRYFRGTIPRLPADSYDPLRPGQGSQKNLVLFGDPQSNPLIAKVLPKLPITWTKEKLNVNGVEYDPRTHIPVLIYPNPLDRNRHYVVINSGHTFKEPDLKEGSGALLYPRLGDWAVIKITPTEKDPTAGQVVAAGLFDSNWTYKK